MKAYKLLKDMPGLDAGAVFVHDKKDYETGSVSHGSLKLAWDNGNCQFFSDYGWCANAHILPGKLADSKKWFEKIKNEKVKRNGRKTRRYTC